MLLPASRVCSIHLNCASPSEPSTNPARLVESMLMPMTPEVVIAFLAVCKIGFREQDGDLGTGVMRQHELAYQPLQIESG